MSDNHEQWVKVVCVGGRKRRFVKSSAVQLSTSPPGLNDCLSDDSMPVLRSKYKSMKGKVCNSSYVKSLVPLIKRELASIVDRHFEESQPGVLCYGIGNVANDKTSLCQLAVLEHIIEQCDLNRSTTFLYDPLFRKNAEKFVQELGLQLINHNEEAVRPLRAAPCLVYLPHCALSLTNNLLYANWSPDVLQNLLFFSNSWHQGLAAIGIEAARSNVTYMWSLRDCVTERDPCAGLLEEVCRDPDENHIRGCFETMTVQTFAKDQLAALPTDIWENRSKPVYNNDIVGEFLRAS